MKIPKTLKGESEISGEAENHGSAKHFQAWCMAFKKNVKKLSDEIFLFRGRRSLLRDLASWEHRVATRRRNRTGWGEEWKSKGSWALLPDSRDSPPAPPWSGGTFSVPSSCRSKHPCKKENEICYITLKT